MMFFKMFLAFKRAGDQRGFTLVEAAVIVTILGLVIAPFFNHLTSQIEKKKMLERDNMNEVVTAALTLFVTENNRYPVPADSLLGPSSVSYGEEVPVSAGPGACTDNVCVFDTTPPTGNLTYIGALPTTALRLPAEAAVNRHGWKFFYAVSANLTVAPSSGTGALTVWIDSNDDGITGLGPAGAVLDATDNSIAGAHFVLVDPGKDGKGSVSLDGAPAPFACALTAGDYPNCEFTIGGANPTVFNDVRFSSRWNVNLAEHFDDEIIYSLAREETTFWQIDQALNPDGSVDIGARALGNVGIGTSTPREKLHVVGGSMKVNGTSGGNSITANDIEALNSDVVTSGALDAGDMIGTGEAFYYPQ